MPRILIIYYSHTGNTEKMATAIAEGARTVEEVEVEMKRYESPGNLLSFDAILIGAPTYQHTMTPNIKSLLEEIAFREIDLKDRFGAVFGSYGWSGEAPRMVLEVLENKFEMDVLKPALLIKYTPDASGLEQCRKFGMTVAEKISESS
jgi:flavorubredoxin